LLVKLSAWDRHLTVSVRKKPSGAGHNAPVQAKQLCIIMQGATNKTGGIKGTCLCRRAIVHQWHIRASAKPWLIRRYPVTEASPPASDCPGRLHVRPAFQ
jgi:hypothetical protein